MRADGHEPDDDASLEDLLREGDGDDPGSSRARWRVAAIAAVIFALVVTLASLQLLNRGPSATGSVSAANFRAVAKADGRLAPDFQLPLLDGSEELSLATLRGHVVVLNFWASWCGPCRLEASALESTSKSYGSRGVQFIGVDERDDAAAASAFQDEFKISYPSLSDPAGALASDFTLIGLPTTFVMDADGRMLYRFTGFLDEATLTQALNDVLSR